MVETVLIIEDDSRIADWIKIYFSRAGFMVEVAYDGKKGLQMARALCPDLVVLDLMLPGIDGMDVCEILRMETDVPIIILTARGGQPDRVRGLEHGADDYIVKPFDADELIARARAVLRRYEGRVQSTIRSGKLIVDQQKHQVLWEGQIMPLSHAQFSILAALMRHPNQVLSRAQIITLAFDDGFGGSERAIDTYIRRLRKLVHREDFQPIQTVYGAGYKFCCEE